MSPAARRREDARLASELVHPAPTGVRQLRLVRLEAALDAAYPGRDLRAQPLNLWRTRWLGPRPARRSKDRSRAEEGC